MTHTHTHTSTSRQCCGQTHKHVLVRLFISCHSNGCFAFCEQRLSFSVFCAHLQACAAKQTLTHTRTKKKKDKKKKRTHLALLAAVSSTSSLNSKKKQEGRSYVCHSTVISRSINSSRYHILCTSINIQNKYVYILYIDVCVCV